jgi:predicted CXXCH cytochrome family protein
LLLALVGIGLLGLSVQDVRVDLGTERDLHRNGYVGSASCRRCHTDHTESWRRTFHRTMTQAASEDSVRGDFSGVTLDYFGVRARMERGEKGEFVIRYGSPAFPERRFVVEKTVGSRRYQQYVAQSGTELVRLPVAYHLEERRWFHMNGAFLTPDPQPSDASASRVDYERHLTRWNDNCVFCHNVHPNPGKRGATFETEVAELGVGCEACHGPGEEHARRNLNPVRRYALHLSGARDPSIVNPGRLSPERAADVCGRCHGQRVTDDVNAFLTRGDPFVPGDDLALYSAPLWHDTALGDQNQLFAARFWPDGTPRLTAYEYQGMLLSPCSARGKLTCTSCHGMHEGDPRGQLRETDQAAAMCTQCHEQLAPTAQQIAHARHGGSPPSCVACHMPKLVYGVLATHPSHRIEIPNPARDAALGRPDACTLCHTDRTRSWAAQETARLFGVTSPEPPSPTSWSEVETRLFAGDPIERAVAADALGGSTTPSTGHQAALLLEVLEQDPYPAVRRFAARALARRVPALAARLSTFVPESTPDERHAMAAELRKQLGGTWPSSEILKALRAQAEAQAIDIGE